MFESLMLVNKTNKYIWFDIYNDQNNVTNFFLILKILSWVLYIVELL